MDIRQVPEYLRIGPPYLLTGNESRRCCAAISALARALRRTNKVAIATFVKTRDKDPVLCGLFPLEDGDEPLHLVIMRLPFSGDIKYFFHLSSFDSILAKDNPKATIACDDLIDNLMLPDGSLEYSAIPNPKVRSFYKTVIKRVIDRKAQVVDIRNNGQDSTNNKMMETPKEISDRAQPAVDAFYNAFSLKRVAEKSA
jgi:hypothetical protein